MHQDKDRGAKWLIEHHGDAILKLAGIEGIASWKAVHSEVIAPRRLPDGILEVKFADSSTPTSFLIEVETHADHRAAEQIFEDVLLMRIERGIVPNAILVVLKPRGKVRIANRREETSSFSATKVAATWQVVELWNLQSDDLLAQDDVGLIPWVPLTQMSGPPDRVLQQCRNRIDRLAAPSQREPLLVATAILSTVLFDDQMLGILGVSETMIESPYLDRIVEKRERRAEQRAVRSAVITVLRSRFGTVPASLQAKLDLIDEPARLEQLLEFASVCPDQEWLMAEMK